MTSRGDGVAGPPLEVLRIDAGRGSVATGLRWDGGDGRPVLMLHPNGFGAGVFAPLGPLLAHGRQVIALDLRGHGGSAGPGGDRSIGSYQELATDLLDALDVIRLEEPLVVGQSLGGAVAVLADWVRPGWARHLALFEPAAYPQRPGPSENPLAQQARRRRREWASTDELLDAYREKPALTELGDEALLGYIEHGARETPQGTVVLSCAPATEAALFELATSPDGGAAALGHLANLHCTLSISAGTQSFLPAEFFEAQAHRAGIDLRPVTGGHFFLQAEPVAAAQLLLDEFDAVEKSSPLDVSSRFDV
jgi:pimeloyl-ACP methyl ester carboxylesterase